MVIIRKKFDSYPFPHHLPEKWVEIASSLGDKQLPDQVLGDW
jgi:hypothetical protein